MWFTPTQYTCKRVQTINIRNKIKQPSGRVRTGVWSLSMPMVRPTFNSVANCRTLFKNYNFIFKKKKKRFCLELYIQKDDSKLLDLKKIICLTRKRVLLYSHSHGLSKSKSTKKPWKTMSKNPHGVLIHHGIRCPPMLIWRNLGHQRVFNCYFIYFSDLGTLQWLHFLHFKTFDRFALPSDPLL
jgi:hypothetical protein